MLRGSWAWDGCVHKIIHTRLEGHWTTWSAAYPMAWCEEYARLLSRAPVFLRMLTTYHPVASTDTSYKHVSSVSMLRHWPEYPSYYLTGDLDTARQTSVSISPAMENLSRYTDRVLLVQAAVPALGIDPAMCSSRKRS